LRITDNKIWYYLNNLQDYINVPDIIRVDKDSYRLHIHSIKESISLFNDRYDWPGMWDIETAFKRLEEGQILYLGYDEKGPLAHVWSNNNYFYNVFVDKRRPKDYGVKFIWACLNNLNFREVEVYVDTWNIRSQKYSEKIGFKMNYSKTYSSYLDNLISSLSKQEASTMYPPGYEGELIRDIPSNTSTIVFTTGTTGNPKPVFHSFRSIRNAIEQNTSILGINQHDTLLNFLPTWTIGTYIYTVPTYMQGGKIIHDKFSPEKLAEYIKLNPTTTLLIPTMIDMMKESKLSFDLSCFRNIGVGAEQVDKHHLEYLLELGAKSVTHMYGSSEAIPLALYNTFTSKEQIHLGLKPVKGFRYKNSDSLLINGISVADSYYNGDSIDWFDTKDMFIYKDGLYYWQRRTDNIVKKKGWKAVIEREYDIIEKEFSPDLDPSTLVWHTDSGDREVTILETGGGWKFEAKDRTPLTLKEGDIVYVSKTTLHKIHKGDGNLKVRIKQYK